MGAPNRFYSSTAVGAQLLAPMTAGQLTATVNSTVGWPTSFPYTAVIDGGNSNEEIVNVTSSSGGTLTIARGQDGTTAATHSNGATVTHDVSARDFAEPQQHMANTSGVHGVAGNVVGDSDTQTLTNKTLSGGSVSGADVTGGTINGAPTTSTVTTTGTQTLTNKTLSAPTTSGGTSTGEALVTPTLSGGSGTGVALDATSSLGGITGTQLAALEAAVSAPLAGTLGANKTSNGTLFTIGSLAIGTWLITVPVLLFNTVNSSGTITATGASGITLTGVSSIILNCTSSEPAASGALSFLATVGTAGLVTVTLSALAGSAAAIEATYTGYTAVRVA